VKIAASPKKARVSESWYMAQVSTAGPIAFVSVMDGDPWGGSEELWWGAAIRLLGEGIPVSASVQQWVPVHSKIQTLREAGCDLLERPKVYPLWKRGLRSLRRGAKPSIHALDTEQWLRKRPPSLVVINNIMSVPHIDLMEMCTRNGWPFLFVSHANAEYAWCEDWELDRYHAALSKAVRCYYVSKGNLDLAHKQVGLPLSKVAILRNPFGVDFDISLPWPETSADRSLQMACVGRLDPRSKGQDILFDVLSTPKWRDRAWSLNLYGAGRCREGLVRLVAECGLQDKVHFKGHQKVDDIWRENHVLVLPSRAEGLPITIVEAMLCARPVLTTDVAGNAEFLENEVTGFIADAPTTRQVGDALERLWRRRSDLQSMGTLAAAAIRSELPRDPVGDFVRALKLARAGRPLPIAAPKQTALATAGSH